MNLIWMEKMKTKKRSAGLDTLIKLCSLRLNRQHVKIREDRPLLNKLELFDIHFK